MGVAWNGNNIGGATKRAVGIAMHVGFGNLGGVIAGFSFRAQDAPRYFSGHGLLIGTITMSMILCVFMNIYLKRENARRDAAMVAQGLTLDSYTSEMRLAESEKGDNATASVFLSTSTFFELTLACSSSATQNRCTTLLQVMTRSWTEISVFTLLLSSLLRTCYFQLVSSYLLRTFHDKPNWLPHRFHRDAIIRSKWYISYNWSYRNEPGYLSAERPSL